MVVVYLQCIRTFFITSSTTCRYQVENKSDNLDVLQVHLLTKVILAQQLLATEQNASLIRLTHRQKLTCNVPQDGSAIDEQLTRSMLQYTCMQTNEM